MKACIYARCSTDEMRQDTENQLRELRRYCEAMEWSYDVVSEYDSAYKGKQAKLQEVLKHIQHGRYQVLVVFSLDRFSRAHPSKVNALLDTIVERDGCRFIAKQEGIDSDQEMTWHIVKPMFAYFAHLFSRNLSEKIRAGIKTKKEKGSYTGGRPKKQVDTDRLASIVQANGRGLRGIASAYNEGLPPSSRISYGTVSTLLKKNA